MIKITKKIIVSLEMNEEQATDLLIALNYNAGESSLCSRYSDFMEEFRTELDKNLNKQEEDE